MLCAFVIFLGDFYTTFSKYDNRQLTEVLLTTDNTYLEFSLRACHSAIIALGNGTDFDSGYYLVIGKDNYETFISQKDNGQEGG